MKFTEPDKPILTASHLLRCDNCGEGFMWPVADDHPKYCPVCGNIVIKAEASTPTRSESRYRMVCNANSQHRAMVDSREVPLHRCLFCDGRATVVVAKVGAAEAPKPDKFKALMEAIAKASYYTVVGENTIVIGHHEDLIKTALDNCK